MSTSLQERVELLNSRFAVAQQLRFTSHDSGQVVGVVSTPVCDGEFFLHGAHVTRYRPRGFEELLFVSDEAIFRDGKAIRGGVPICFPWFGPHPTDPAAPAHGHARTHEWELTRTANSPAGALQVELHAVFDPFDVVYTIEFGSELTLSLKVTNQSPTPVTFEAALHSYFRLKDVREVAVSGLESVAFLDQLTGATEAPSNAPIRFTEETDRIYQDNLDVITISDRLANRNVVIEKRGAPSTIVWNPWIAKSQRTGDFGDEEWTQMCCIESASVGANAIELATGESHELVAKHRLVTQTP